MVEKSATDLALPAFTPERLFRVASGSAGYIREFVRGRDVTIGAGASGTMHFVPAALTTMYGSRTPLGMTVFLRLRPYHSPHAQAE